MLEKCIAECSAVLRSQVLNSWAVLTALQCEGLQGLWRGACRYVLCALVSIYSACTRHESQWITLPSALLLNLSGRT